jgi:phospholipid N-methyltransferase
MPGLDTKMHLKMLKQGRWERKLTSRFKKAIKVFRDGDDVYGLEWGDPEVLPPLRYVKNHFLAPYLSPNSTVLEIGPGGGRWTRYMLDVNRVYAVDYHQELLDELKSNFSASNIAFIKNNGDDFPNIQNESIDFLFSFGTFVHLDTDIINRYLGNMKRLLKPSSNAVIQYSDKTKPIAKQKKGFSDNDPEKMRELVLSHGFSIYEEDVKTMWHSSIVRFGLRDESS